MKMNLQSSRYTVMNLSILVFVVLIVSIFALNLYSNRKIAEGNASITAAKQLDSMIQSMSRDVFGLKIRYGESPYSSLSQISLKRLAQNSAIFSEILHVFDQGGVLKLGEDQAENKEIPALDIATERELLQNLTQKWNALKPQIDDYVTTATDIDSTQKPLDLAASALLNASSTDMPSLTNGLVESIDRRNTDSANFLRTMLLFGIGAAIFYFAFFIFFFVRRLHTADAQIEAARKDTANIMRTVSEGLFLVDTDLNIGGQYSDRLEKILCKKDIAHRSLEALLAELISDTDMQATRKFIQQLLNPKVVESLIIDLNPLQRVQTVVKDLSGVMDTRWLSFAFSRVHEQNKISQVLVSVADISETVRMEESLEKQRLHNEEQLEMLASILHISSSDLTQFIETAQSGALKINETLKVESKNDLSLEDKLKIMYREAHSIKGEASALNLKGYVGLLNEFEGKIKTLQHQNNLEGKDFLTLAINLDQLMKMNEKIEDLRDRLHRGGLDKIVDKPETAKDWISSDFFVDFAKRIAERHHKKVDIEVSGFDGESVSHRQQGLIKDIAIQFVRNAVVHGVEAPENRLLKGKSETGIVMIRFEKMADQTAQLVIEDDGQGINYDLLAEKAAEAGIVPQSPTEGFNKRELIQFMFSSGVSTATSLSEDAGRGVGSDVIRDRIKQLRGRIGIQSEAGKFTRFKVSFPS